MAPTILLVGGCPAPYHRLEPAAPPIVAALAELGLSTQVSGITHPDGGNAFEGDYSALTRPALDTCRALVLYTTGQDRFGADTAAIIDWVRDGGALIGIHNATDSFTDDPAFVKLWGGKFRTHPAQLPIETEFVDTEHEITQGLAPFTVTDELYLYADYDPARVHLLAQTRSYDDNGPVPICWTREEGRGRVFFVSLGHNPETLADPAWKALFQRGVKWAMRG